MKIRSNGTVVNQQFIFKFILALMIGFALIVAGLLTALAPQFIARLLPIPLLIFMIFIAFLSRSDHALGDQFLKAWLTILLSVMALWPTYMFVKVGGLPSFDARKIVAGLSLAAMLFLVISRKSVTLDLFKRNTGPMLIGSLMVLAYAIWRFASCFVSISPIASLIQVFWEVLYYFSMYFIGALFFSSRNLQVWAMKVFMVLAVLIAGYSLVEWVTQKNILLTLAPISAEFAEYKAALSISRMRDGFFRAQGTFEHPLLLAEFSAMAACFGLSAWLWPNDDRKFKLLGLITFISSIIAALLTGSRSAIITLAAGAGFVFLLWFFSPKGKVKSHNQSFRKIGFVMTLITALTIALPSIALLAQGKSQDQAASTAGRLVMLQQGIPSIEKYPMFGKGPGSAGQVAGIKTGSGINTLDNYYLSLAIESGVPALLLLLGTFTYPLWLVFNSLLNGKGTFTPIVAGSSGAIVVSLITHSVLWMPYNLTFVFLFSGILHASLTKFDLDIRYKNKTTGTK